MLFLFSPNTDLNINGIKAVSLKVPSWAQAPFKKKNSNGRGLFRVVIVTLGLVRLGKVTFETSGIGLAGLAPSPTRVGYKD